MKAAIYQKAMMRRKNPIADHIVNFIYNLTTVPKLTLEVFIRKSFGERYFSFAMGIITCIVLSVLPYFFPTTDKYPFSIFQMIGANLLWYGYVGALVTVLIIRKREIAREPSVFDFAKYSLYQGKHVNWYIEYIILKIPYLTPRVIDKVVDPGFFFLIGLLSILLNSPFLGVWLIFSSLCYHLSNTIAYHQGDHFVMDLIDGDLVVRQMENSLVFNMSPEETQGFSIYGRRPVKMEDRRAIYEKYFGSNGDNSSDLDSEPIEERPNPTRPINGLNSQGGFATVR